MLGEQRSSPKKEKILKFKSIINTLEFVTRRKLRERFQSMWAPALASREKHLQITLQIDTEPITRKQLKRNVLLSIRNDPICCSNKSFLCFSRFEPREIQKGEEEVWAKSLIELRNEKSTQGN